MVKKKKSPIKKASPAPSESPSTTSDRLSLAPTEQIESKESETSIQVEAVQEPAAAKLPVEQPPIPPPEKEKSIYPPPRKRNSAKKSTPQEKSEQKKTRFTQVPRPRPTVVFKDPPAKRRMLEFIPPWNYRGENTCWDNIPDVDKCCFCIPLHMGAIFIAICGILYGAFAIYVIFSMLIFPHVWNEYYQKKVDFLVYLFFFLLLAASVLVFSFILLYGILKEDENSIIRYLWYCVWHIMVNFVLAICTHYYCLIENKDCFGGLGMIVPIAAIGLSLLYMLPWIYAALVVNSYRMDKFMQESD